MIKEKYVKNGLSIRQIATELLCSKEAVRSGLIKEGVELRKPNQHHGRPSQPKYGSQYRNGNLIKHLGEQRVIQTVNEMSDEGMSLRQIARFLDQIGVPTKCKGKKWHPQMVKNIIVKASSSKVQILTDGKISFDKCKISKKRLVQIM